MAYTRPDSTAADATWEGASAYTRPSPSAADARWNTVADIQGPGAIGAPQSTTYSLAGLIQGEGVLGAPAAATHSLAVLLEGSGILGAPRAMVQVGISGKILGQGVIGVPASQGHTVAAQLTGHGIIGIIAGRAHTVAAQAQGAGLIGIPQAAAFALPALAANIPEAVTYYHCKLTGASDGLTDAVLPMSSFSVRHRYDALSYYQLTIPSYAYVSAIAARPNGQIVIWSDTGGITEELLRGDLASVRSDRGPKSQSISISGNSARAATTPVTYLITNALYAYSTFEGEARLRIPPRAAIRPGDYMRYADLNFRIGEVSWSVAVSAGGMAITMEVTSLAINA